MVKKGLMVLVLTVLIVGGAFALDISYGLGGYFINDAGGGVEAVLNNVTIASLKTPYKGGGIYAFYDFSYFEANAGFFITSGEWEDYGNGLGTITHDVSCFGCHLGLYGKYPFMISDKLTVFPLLGLSMQSVLSVKIDGEKVSGEDDLFAVWFKAGGGIDFNFSSNKYLRMEALYGLRLSNRFEDDMADDFRRISMGRADVKTLLGHGLDIKLAIGFSLN
jgi:hypothetical protein